MRLRMASRVVDEVAHQPLELVGATEHAGRADAAGVDRERGRGAHAGGFGEDEIVEVDARPAAWSALVEPGEQQQIVDQALDPEVLGDARPRPARRPTWRPGCAIATSRVLADRGHRRAKLVRGVRDEPPLPDCDDSSRASIAVHRGGQARDLVARRGLGHPAIQRTGRDRSRPRRGSLRPGARRGRDPPGDRGRPRARAAARRSQQRRGRRRRFAHVVEAPAHHDRPPAGQRRSATARNVPWPRRARPRGGPRPRLTAASAGASTFALDADDCPSTRATCTNSSSNSPASRSGASPGSMARRRPRRDRGRPPARSPRASVQQDHERERAPTSARPTTSAAASVVRTRTEPARPAVTLRRHVTRRPREAIARAAHGLDAARPNGRSSLFRRCRT